MSRQSLYRSFGFMPCLWLLTLVVSLAFEQAKAGALPDSIVDALKQTHQAVTELKTIHLASESQCSEWDAAQNQWRETPVGKKLEFWTGFSSSGPFKMQCFDECMPWTNGKAPFFHQAYTLAFDGTNYRRLDTSYGYNGKTTQSGLGKIVPVADHTDQDYRPTFESGFMAFLPFLKVQQGGIDLMDFRGDAEVNSKIRNLFQTSSEAEGTIVGLTLQLPDDHYSIKYSFDPSKGFAFVKSVASFGGKYIEETTILEHVELRPGVYFPQKFELITKKDGKPEKRVQVAVKVLHLSELYPPEFFKMEFPARTRMVE